MYDLTKSINFSNVFDSHPDLLVNYILENDTNCSRILYKIFKQKALLGTPLASGQSSGRATQDVQDQTHNTSNTPNSTKSVTFETAETISPQPHVPPASSNNEIDIDVQLPTLPSQGIAESCRIATITLDSG